MISALLLANVVTGATNAPVRPATDWTCDFTDTAAGSFHLKGSFAEAPAGGDPNAGYWTVVSGDGPAPLVGKAMVKAFDSHADVRSYQYSAYAKDGSNYVATFSFMPGERMGLATITRYVPDPVTLRGKLFAYATGYCRAVFHPAGAGVPKK